MAEEEINEEEIDEEEIDEEEIDEEGGNGKSSNQVLRGSRVRHLMVLVILVLVVQIAVIYVLVTKLILPKQGIETKTDGTRQSNSQVEVEKYTIATPVLYEFGEMVLNPMDDNTIRYLNTKITVELDKSSVLDELNENKVIAAQISDLLRRILNTTYYHQMDQPSERIILRENLKRRLNESLILKTGQVTAVYFERFVVQ